MTRPLLKRGLPLLLDATVEDRALSICFDALQKEDRALSICFDALQKVVDPSRLGDFHYIPIVFDAAERPQRLHKELLELYGVILGELQGRLPSSGLLMHGQKGTVHRIKLASRRQSAQRVLQEIQDLRSTGTPPQLMLNSHLEARYLRLSTSTILGDV